MTFRDGGQKFERRDLIYLATKNGPLIMKVCCGFAPRDFMVELDPRVGMYGRIGVDVDRLFAEGYVETVTLKEFEWPACLSGDVIDHDRKP
jgi:hypothetical protein